MKTRRLGSLSVSAVGYGCMGLSGTYGAIDEKDAIALLRKAVDLGVTMFDSADAYGPFRNEEIVGEALRPMRDRVVIATKFGQQILPDGTRRVNGAPDYVRSACEASLKRLGIDSIDLYYAHRIDKTVPIEDTVGEMAKLVAEGKVKRIGLCEASPETIRRAHKVHPLTAVQTEYSLWTREVEERILPTCRELGIGFVPYSPLGRGFLTGGVASEADLAPNDVRKMMPRFQGDNLEANKRAVAKVDAIAAAKKVTPAQLALAWVLSRGDDLVPIPGTRRLSALQENIAATDLILSAEDIRALEGAVPLAEIKGERYGAPMMATLER